MAVFQTGSPPSDGVLSSLDTPAVVVTPLENLKPESVTDDTSVSRKSSGSGSGCLSLRIPPTLTSQSPGLFSNVSVLEEPGGVDSPEIARLLNLYDGKGNVPRTAEVLNAVLDITNQRKMSAPPQFNAGRGEL